MLSWFGGVDLVGGAQNGARESEIQVVSSRRDDKTFYFTAARGSMVAAHAHTECTATPHAPELRISRVPPRAREVAAFAREPGTRICSHSPRKSGRTIACDSVLPRFGTIHASSSLFCHAGSSRDLSSSTHVCQHVSSRVLFGTLCVLGMSEVPFAMLIGDAGLV